MPYNFAGGGGGDQGWLLPPDPREWLPGGHLAWAVRDAVAQMDLAPFVAWYRADGQGKKAYHPALMVALVMYCYCKGIRSSRAVEMATFDDVGARVLAENLHPDHATIARFVSRHEQAVKGLLVASLVACARQGLVSVDVVAGDGTKVKANASMAANATVAGLEADIAGLEQLLEAEVTAWLEQAKAADAAEDALFGGGDDGRGPGGGPGSLARLTGKIVRRQQAKAKLEAAQAARRQQAEAGHAAKITRLERRAADRRAGAGRLAAQATARVQDYQRRAAAKAAAGARNRPDGRIPVPAGRHSAVRRARAAAAKAQQALGQAAAQQAAAAAPAKPPKVNTTDPASGVMPAKKGGFGQLHNVQALAGKHQVIYAIGTHPNATDTGALHPLLEKGRANLDAAGITSPIGTALFDAGYASDDNFTTSCEPELYVAVTREARQTGRLRDGKHPQTMKASWQQMAARLDTPEGKALYRQRAGIIEPVFAQLFSRLGRNLNYRDTKTGLELHLWAATHNLLKAIRAQARTTVTSPPGRLAPAT
ncbi:MAG TPA: transposase [Streptosporangiaceae bacterium]|jgi:transposase